MDALDVRSQIQARLELAGLWPPVADEEARPLRWRYFQHRRQMFCWTTVPDYCDDCPDCGGCGEVLGEDRAGLDPVETCERCNGSGIDHQRGWFYSFTYKPVGKGARTGKATEWRLDNKSKRRHRKRKDAKARALKMLGKAKNSK